MQHGFWTFWPGLGEGADPDIEPGARDRELHELLAAYREAGGDGIVVAPTLARHGAAFVDVCEDAGVSWMLHCDDLDLDAVRAGPPVD